MPHDHVSSVLSLARNVLDSIDPATTHTPVQNESLKLLLNTLFETARPANRTNNEQLARTVAGMIAPPILDDRETKRGWL